MTENIPISITDIPEFAALFKHKPLRPDQIAWPKSQRKRRKNARRAFAAGKKDAFNRS